MAEIKATTIIRTFEFKIRPNRDFVEKCDLVLNSCRELYNAALEQRISVYRHKGVSLSHYEQSRQLTDARKEFIELRSIYRDIQEDVLLRLDRAYSAFFRRLKTRERSGHPRFKNKDRYSSFGCSYRGKTALPIIGDKLQMHGVGSCRIRMTRTLKQMGVCKHVRMLKRVDGWYVQLVCEVKNRKRRKPVGKDVGVDLGVEYFATLSTGEQIPNPRILENAERKLSTLCRRVSRKKKGSTSRHKARKKVRQLYLKIRRRTSRFHVSTARDLVKKYDYIAIEDIRILNLFKGTIAKSLISVGWGQFIGTLKVKAEEAGREVKMVNPSYTSQDCSNCGTRVMKSLTIRQHICPECGVTIHRDLNAAINILKKARAERVQSRTSVESDSVETL